MGLEPGSNEFPVWGRPAVKLIAMGMFTQAPPLDGSQLLQALEAEGKTFTDHPICARRFGAILSNRYDLKQHYKLPVKLESLFLELTKGKLYPWH